MKKLLLIVLLLFINYASDACIRYRDIVPDSLLRMDDTSQFGTGADIDMDGDGQPDFSFMWMQFPGFGWSIFVNATDTASAVVQGSSATQFGDTLAMPLVKDTLIGPASAWGVINMMGKVLADSTELGFAGLGDRYIGIRMKVAGGYRYGWILVNADTASTSKGITIKAYALDYAIDVPIKAGDTGVLLQNVIAYGKGGVSRVLKTATLQMETSYSPSPNANNGMRWTVSNTAKATINSNGLLTALDTGNVVVTVTDTCSGKSDDTTITIYAFKTNITLAAAASSEVTVYPIPARNVLNVVQEASEVYTDAHILSADGRVVGNYTLNNDKTEMDVSHLPAGNYTIILVNKQRGKHIVSIVKD